VPPIEQTARFCGMRWETPHIVYGADDLDDAQLSTSAIDLVQRLSPWREPTTPKVAETSP
jgi:glutathione-regulated potassium-efflux system ancillary protein KefF